MDEQQLSGLSPEDQAALAQIMRQKQFAQMLQQRSMQSQPTEYSPGGMAVRQSPLSALVRGAQGYFGSKWQDNAETQRAGLMEKSQAAQQEELQALMADPKNGISRALASRNPRVQAAAAALKKEQQERDKLVTEIGAKINAPKALENLIAGTPGSVGDFPAPEVRTLPNGPGGKDVPVLINTGECGRQNASAFPQGTTVSVDARQGTREGEMALDVLKTQLTGRQEKATAAKETLASSSFALDALEQGAKAGGGEPTKQILRKALQAVGMEVPATAEIDQLEMALGNAVLAQIAKLRPASDTDFKALQKIMGSVGTDPKALVKGLAYANSIAIRDLDQFGNYVNEQKQNLINPNARDLFSGASSGYELPSQLNGPLPFQLETLRQIQRQGGDISKFRDPEGNPFPVNTKFDIDPTNGFPGIPRKPTSTAAPAAKPRFKPISEMTEAEKRAELAALKAAIGGKP